MMVDIYYMIKKKLGLKICSDRRIENCELLYPEKKPEEVIREKDEKTIKKVAACLLLVFMIAFILLIISETGRKATGSIERNSYGGGEKEVVVNALIEGEEITAVARIESAMLSQEEIEKKFADTKEEMFESLKADNESLEHVEGKVDFSTDHTDEDVDVYWQCDNYDIIDYNGEIQYDENFAEGTLVKVSLILSIGEEKKVYDKEIQIYKIDRDKLSASELLEAEIDKANEEQIDSSRVELPTSIDGKEVSYVGESNDKEIILITVLGIALTCAVIYKRKKDEDTDIQERSEELEREYPEFVSKLGIYIGAGLSVRKTIEKMVGDYRTKLERGGKRNALYEELAYYIRRIESGKTEEESLRLLGDRLSGATYLRLISVLESNRKDGRTHLESFLFAESKEAGMIRLEIAKRQGEKISSKLLVPMIILFAIVLTVLIIPAFLGF